MINVMHAAAQEKEVKESKSFLFCFFLNERKMLLSL
jgi:hypothetical protein